jgi:hypothetical protein
MKVYRGHKGIDPLILNPSVGGHVRFRSPLIPYPLGRKRSYPISSTTNRYSILLRPRSNELTVFYWREYFFPLRDSPLVGQGLPIIDALRSHSDTPHLVALLWTSDHPDAKTSTWQHTTRTRDRHPYPQRDSNPQSQQVSGRRPMPSTARPLGLAPLMGMQTWTVAVEEIGYDFTAFDWPWT